MHAQLSRLAAGALTTYPPWIKDKDAAEREPSPAPGRRRAGQVAPASTPPDELQRVKDELRIINQQLSKIGQLARPGSDAAKHQPLPQKQDLLQQKVELERKIRALTSPR